MSNVVLYVFIVYRILYKINSIIILNTPRLIGVSFISQIHNQFNRNTFKYDSCNNNKIYKLNSLATGSFDKSVFSKYGFKIANIDFDDEDFLQISLSELYSSEDSKSLISILNEYLSFCNDEYVSSINEKIIDGEEICLTDLITRCIVSLANRRETGKLIKLFREISNFNRVLDVFHFAFSARYFAQMGVDDIDFWHKLISDFNDIKNLNYRVFISTDDLKPFVSDKINSEINSLSLFGLNHSFIFDRNLMESGIYESLSMALLRYINKFFKNSENDQLDLDSNSKLFDLLDMLNSNIKTWIARVIISHINRILSIDGDNDRLFTNIEIESKNEDSYIDTIDKIIMTPLSQIKNENIIKPQLILPRFIYPSTHSQILNEMNNSSSFSMEFANILFSDIKNVDEIPISDIYYISRYMLKFKKGTFVLKSLLNFDILKSEIPLEHIKCALFECEIERDHIEALNVLNKFKKIGITHPQGLIDDLAMKLKK